MTTDIIRFHFLNAQFDTLIRIRDQLRQDGKTDLSLFRYLDGIEQNLRRQLAELTENDRAAVSCR